MSQKIQVIYEQSCAAQAERVIDWILSEGIAKQDEEEVRSPSGFCSCSFSSDIEIASDAAIIFVSDTATGNKDWQAHVRALPETVRLIPAGMLRDVDYNDPEIVPPCIEAVNFIALDDKQFENILDSLTTSPEFYSMKNHLLSKCNAWAMGHNEGDLLTNVNQINEYHALITHKLGSEHDPFLKKQLNDLLDYLDDSLKYAKKIRRQKYFRWFQRGSIALAFIAILILVSVLKASFGRASRANMVMSSGVDQGEPKVNALKMMEGMYNPSSSDSAEKIAFMRLVECLDKTWDQNPVGVCYKHELFDCAIPDGSRYLWTAADDGTALLWDTYDGTIAEKEAVSDQPLYVITLDRADSAQNAAAIDAQGSIFIKTDGKWQAALARTAADPAGCECIMDGDKLLIFDDAVIEIYELKQNGLDIADSLDHNRDIADGASILNADISQGSIIIAARSRENKLIIARQNGDIGLEAKELPVTLSDRSVSDFHNGNLIITDADGQVWRVRCGQTEKEEKAEKIPLVLAKPIALRFVNEDTVVYHERNKGTGVYSLDPFFDYGGVLDYYDVASDLITSDELLAVDISGVYYPVAWEEILPVSADSQGVAVFSEKTAACSDDGAVIRKAEITDFGLINATLDLGTEQPYVVIDPAGVLDNTSGYTDSRAKLGLPEDYYDYEESSFTNKSAPTVVGIRHEPASEMNDKTFSYLLIGTEDGSFIEIGFQEGDGVNYTSAKHQIPTRAAIVSITQIEDGYLLKDKVGLTWRCQSGVNLITRKGACAIVRQKLHSGVSKDLYDMISKEIRNKLELEVFPGGDGKEWE